jgi:hypothetical protein
MGKRWTILLIDARRRGSSFDFVEKLFVVPSCYLVKCLWASDFLLPASQSGGGRVSRRTRRAMLPSVAHVMVEFDGRTRKSIKHLIYHLHGIKNAETETKNRRERCK